MGCVSAPPIYEPDTNTVFGAGNSTIVASNNDVPIVSMWARPSTQCNLPYKWYYRAFIDYCPHCHQYNVLYDAHKCQARYEHEWTCKNCGADYDAVTGKEKYSWSNYYLRREKL